MPWARNVFTLQTLPAGDEPFGDSVGQVAGFSLHAGVIDIAYMDVGKEREHMSRDGR